MRYWIVFILTATQLVSCKGMDTSTKDEVHEGATLTKTIKDFLDFSTGKPTTYEYKKDPVTVLRTKSMDTAKRTRLLVDIALPVTLPPSKIKKIAIKRAYGILSQQGADVVRLRVWPSGFPNICGEMGEVEVSKDNGGWDGKSEDKRFVFLPPNTPWKSLSKQDIDILIQLDRFFMEGIRRGMDRPSSEKAAVDAVAEKTKLNRKKVDDLLRRAKRAFYHPGDMP